MTGPTVCLVILFLLLMATGSNAYRSYTGKYGDEYGYGQMALIKSGLIVLTILWLGVGIFKRPHLSLKDKTSILRGSAGLALSFLTLGMAIQCAAGQDGGLRAVLLAVSGMGLLLTSFQALKNRS